MATYNGSDQRLKFLFQNGGGGGASALVDLTDVSISSPTDGQVLIYDSANDVWINSSAGNPSSLASLSDVTITSPTTGQVLTYNGSAWVNATGGGSGHTYSTTEQVVGAWIDGKPIYEQTVDLGVNQMIPQNSWYASGIVISNVELLIEVKGIGELGAAYNLNAYPNNSEVMLQTARDGAAGYVKWVVVQYTKTTDA